MAVTSYRQGWESEFWFIGSNWLEDIDFNSVNIIIVGIVQWVCMRYACTLILTVYLSRWIDFNSDQQRHWFWQCMHIHALILTVYLSRWIDFKMEDLSYDSIPVGPFENPPLNLTVCMHYACPLNLTVTRDHLSLMKIIWVMIIWSLKTSTQVNWN